MAYVLPPANGGACCDCGELVNPCNCVSPCTLECRSITGTAELCGFPEFVPSTPPRRFRRKELSGGFVRCYFYPRNGECPDPGSGLYPRTESVVSVSSETTTWLDLVQLVFISATATHQTWQAVISYGIARPPRVAGVCLLEGRVNFSLGGSTTLFEKVWSTTVEGLNDTGTQTLIFTTNSTTVRLYTTACGTGSPNAQSKFVALSPYFAPHSERHTFAGACQIHAETCDQVETAEVTIARKADVMDCNPPTGGMSGPACEITSGFDGLIAESTATSRQFQPDGECHVYDGYGWKYTEADASEELSDEDTEADAIARAMLGISWPENGVACANLYTFTSQRGEDDVEFTWRRVQVRVEIRDPQPSAFYRVTVGFVERPATAGGPFLFLGRQVEVTVQADTDPETVEFTDWIDVPIEEGMQIRAGSCSVELIP